jgi:quercetin dioxygenase-like cupin family protein
MSGKFIAAKDVVRDTLHWGSLAWCCRPAETGAKDLVVMEVTLAPGEGHAFHKHPGQEEVIYVLKGTVEQWLDQEQRKLGPGDSVFISGDTVHASFNTGRSEAKLLAIVSPCVNRENGYAVTEVADEEPWRDLRD